MEIVKAYQVIVRAYITKIIPEQCKIFETEQEANACMQRLTTEVIWNTPVNVEVVPVYCVVDGDVNFVLSGTFVDISA